LGIIKNVFTWYRNRAINIQETGNEGIMNNELLVTESHLVQLVYLIQLINNVERMKTTDVPFNKHLEIKTAEGNSDFLLYLDARTNHLNHLGTIHAGALFSLAEASSGEFLLNNFDSISKDVIPMVRKADARFRKIVKGRVYSKAMLVDTTKEVVLDELKTKKRALVKVKADLFDDDYSKVFSSVFEWFIIMD